MLPSTTSFPLQTISTDWPSNRQKQELAVLWLVDPLASHRSHLAHGPRDIQSHRYGSEFGEVPIACELLQPVVILCAEQLLFDVDPS